MEHSDKLDQIGKALLAIQGDVSGVEKASPGQVGQQKYLYADLAATNAATRTYLVAAGIVVTQWAGLYDATAKTMEMTTMFLHADSGQWMKGTLSIPLGKVDAQGYGSCLTYARRYALQAALNLSPEDDDGESASRQTAVSRTPKKNVMADFTTRIDQATTQKALELLWETIDKTPEDDLDAEQFKALLERVNSRLKEITAPRSTRASAPKDDFPGIIDPRDSLDNQFGSAR